jgi:hypothetical protein
VAAELIRDNETPLSVQAEVLGLLAKQGLWTQGGPLPNAGTFAAEYLRDDPVPARAWLQGLPESLSARIKEGSR